MLPYRSGVGPVAQPRAVSTGRSLPAPILSGAPGQISNVTRMGPQGFPPPNTYQRFPNQSPRTQQSLGSVSAKAVSPQTLNAMPYQQSAQSQPKANLVRAPTPSERAPGNVDLINFELSGSVRTNISSIPTALPGSSPVGSGSPTPRGTVQGPFIKRSQSPLSITSPRSITSPQPLRVTAGVSSLRPMSQGTRSAPSLQQESSVPFGAMAHPFASAREPSPTSPVSRMTSVATVLPQVNRQMSNETSVSRMESNETQLLEKNRSPPAGMLSPQRSTDTLPTASPASVATFQNLVVKREFFLGKRQGVPQNDYTFVKELGHGAFGIVYLITPLRGGKDRVCKCIDKKASGGGPEIEDEIRQLQHLDHPGIIRLLEYYEDFKNLYIILGTAIGGDLEELLCSNPPKVAMTEGLLSEVLRQSLEATAYCHMKGIVHKDLKPPNIMFATTDYVNPQVCVVDFGLAEALGGQGQIGASGTPGFMAPEVWAAALGQGNYGAKCDIYSLGAILFYCASGARLPWMPVDASGDSVAALAPAFLQGFQRPPQDEFDGVFCASSQARDLCMKMVSRDDRLRPDAARCLHHQWLRNPSVQTNPLDKDSLKALSESINHNKFQQRILLEAASQIPPHELKQINATFAALDKNGDGTISTAELILGLQGLGMTREDAEAVAKVLDADQSGIVEYSEFVAGLLQRSKLQFQDALWNTFCRYDTDRSGYIDVSELSQMFSDGVLEGGSLLRNKEEARELLSLMDYDRDGQVSFYEFCDYIMQGSPKQSESNSKPLRFEPSDRTEVLSPGRPMSDRDTNMGPGRQPCDACVIL